MTFSDTLLIPLAEGAISILNIGGILAALSLAFIVWQAWTARPRVPNAEQRALFSPPDDLHPSLAGALATGNTDHFQVEAAVIRLAGRGAIRPLPDVDNPQEASLLIVDPTRADHEFERVLLECLISESQDGLISHARLKRLRRKWSVVESSIRAELETRGWFDPKAQSFKLPFSVSGLIGILIAVGMVAVAIGTRSGWPLIGATVVGLTGLAAAGMGSIIPLTTMEGEQRSVPWRDFRHGLAQLRDSGDISQTDLNQLFPYIVAMRLSASYDHLFQHVAATGQIPTWFGNPVEVAQWPSSWYQYWTSLHLAIGPTDATNSRPRDKNAARRFLIGGR